jgi:hypothetical protein
VVYTLDFAVAFGSHFRSCFQYFVEEEKRNNAHIKTHTGGRFSLSSSAFLSFILIIIHSLHVQILLNIWCIWFSYFRLLERSL